MRLKALVVEDDPGDFAEVEDALVSLGHEFSWARNQRDAERLLAAGSFAYILLDVTIPARPQRSKPKPEYCLNFLHNLQQQKSRGMVPVIILADGGSLAADMIRDLLDLGAVDFVGKPVSIASRRLSMVICKVLRGNASACGTEDSSGVPKPFRGGELVLYPDRAELCGVRIVSDRGAGQCLLILSELCEKDASGRFVRRSSDELAVAIRAPGGPGTIAGCIKRIRDNTSQRLKKELGLTCAREDVIQNNWQGYSLREWITVRFDLLTAPARRTDKPSPSLLRAQGA
jgi:DNA-binding response OmpR family regulator